MPLSIQTQSREYLNSLKVNNEQIPTRYKGWLIATKLINGKLWLRWQHPKENIPRYGCPIAEEGLSATLDRVQLMIDLTIKLESEVYKNKQI